MIDEYAWRAIEYPQEGEAQIAETTYGGQLLVAQTQLWPTGATSCFITNRTEELEIVEAEHRDHAVVEQVIADLKGTKRLHTSPRESSTPTCLDRAGRARPQPAQMDTTARPTQTAPVHSARTLRRRWLQIAGRLTRHGQC